MREENGDTVVESLCNIRCDVERLTSLLRGVTGGGFEKRGALEPLEKTEGVLGLLKLGDPMLPSNDGAIVDKRRAHEVLLVTESSSILSAFIPAYVLGLSSSLPSDTAPSFSPPYAVGLLSGVGRREFGAELDRCAALLWLEGVVVVEIGCPSVKGLENVN